MTFTFDLISDLHVETWDTKFDWLGQATSPICVVAGDVARDHEVLEETLQHLSKCYQAVFYIDGNDEHKNYLNNLAESYQDVAQLIDNHDRLVYLQNNVIITSGVAFLSTNGWWNWDFAPEIDIEQCRQWWCDKNEYHPDIAELIAQLAESDAGYLANSISRLQTHPDVKKIVVITHTVPEYLLIAHDVDLDGTYRAGTMGNSLMQEALEYDTQNKISHWCFGHYHGKVDRTINGIRYMNNCRGRGDTRYRQFVYYPLRIEVNV